MQPDIRLANTSWESLLTAHSVLLRGFGAERIWRNHGVTMREYDVLYTLAKHSSPTGPGARIGELQRGVLLSQPGLSRMVARLADRGLVERRGDEGDGRAVLIQLTPAGHKLQRAVGREHARSVARDVGGALTAGEMRQLEALCLKLAAGPIHHPSSEEAEQ